MKCIYCGKDKPEAEFSQEHILPRAIGGNIEPINPLSIDNVCERCNNLSGLFVDAPFIKNWFINNYRSSNSKKYCNLTPQTVLPLTYFGVIEEFAHDDKICEFWLGPTGDTIYHFHVPYPEEPDSSPMIGKPPTSYAHDIDAGFVFLFIRSNNPKWHPTIIFSVLANFNKSEIYLGNGETPPIKNFKNIPESLSELYDKLKVKQAKMHTNTMQVGLYYEDRFLCKLALGIGSLLLNPIFESSEQADLLRKGMWIKNHKERRKLKIHGTKALNSGQSMKGLNEIFSWQGGHSLIVMVANNRLVLYCNFYELHSSVIQITDNPAHWEGKINIGKAFIVAPSIKKAVGPINLMDYIGHKAKPPVLYPELVELEKVMSTFDKLPPFDI